MSEIPRTYPSWLKGEVKSAQKEYTEPTKLLADDGTLLSPGWARHMVFDYDRTKSTPTMRRKEWDFYQISDGRYMIQISFANISIGGYASAAGISEAPATDAAVCPSGSAPTNRSSASAAASGSSKNPMCPESASHTTCACGWAAANCSATAAGMYSSLRPKTKSCRTGERRSISLRSGRAIIPLRSATIPSSSVRYTCSVKSAMASAIRCRLSAANPAPGATRASCSFLPARTSAISRRRFSRFSSVSAFGVEEKSTRPSSISG